MVFHIITHNALCFCFNTLYSNPLNTGDQTLNEYMETN